MGLGARMLHSRLDDPSLPPTERAFIAELAPAFTELADDGGGHAVRRRRRAGCCREYRFQDLSQLNALMEMLERRVSLLGVLSDGARPSATSTCASARENADAGAARRCRWSPPTTGCRSATSAPCR